MEKYKYCECGLDNVYLLNGVRYSETPRGKAVHIENIDSLHRAIGEYLVFEKKTLTGKEIRFLRQELGLSQAVLGVTLGKSGQSIAHWEKDQNNIDGAAERLLRLIYIEQVGENEGVKEMLEQLSKLDELICGDLSFEDTEEGWQPYQMAG